MSEAATDIFDPPDPEVPNDWQVLDFVEAVSTVSDQGRRVKKRDYKPDGNYPVIDQGQEFVGGYTSDEAMLYEGDLPVVIFGDHTLAVKYVDKPFAVGADGVKLLRPNGISDPKYLFYLLQSLRIPSRGYSRHFQFLKRFKLPVAPENDQPRIVAEIEKQFSRLDEAVASLKRVKANLKRYKAAVLKAAVEGKLTEEWRKQHPDIEPASKLLERILAERRTKWEEAELAKMKAKGKEPKNDKWKEKFDPSVPNLEGLYELPPDWTWVRIGDVTDMMSGHAFKKAEYTEQGVRLFQIANVSFGSSKWHEVEHLPKSYLKTWSKLSLSEGDVVMALNRPLLSKSLKICRLSTGDVPAILYQRVGKFLFFLGAVADYFLLYMQSPIYVQQLEGQLQGVNIPFINKGKLLDTPFPLPSSQGEIDEISNVVESKLSVVKELESEVDKSILRNRRLRQSVLEKAFSGGLGTLGEMQSVHNELSKVG